MLREGDTIRVNPALIDVRDETRLWGERYERRLSGMLALQRDIARGIADSLALTLLPQETHAAHSRTRDRSAGIRCLPSRTARTSTASHPPTWTWRSTTSIERSSVLQTARS